MLRIMLNLTISYGFFFTCTRRNTRILNDFNKLMTDKVLTFVQWYDYTNDYRII